MPGSDLGSKEIPDLERMVPPKREMPPTQEKPSIPVLNAVYPPSLTEEISATQREDPEISDMINKWAEIRMRGPTSPREVEFVENNMHDQRGFWRRSPEGTHWHLRVPTTLRQRVT